MVAVLRIRGFLFPGQALADGVLYGTDSLRCLPHVLRHELLHQPHGGLPVFAHVGHLLQVLLLAAGQLRFLVLEVGLDLRELLLDGLELLVLHMDLDHAHPAVVLPEFLVDLLRKVGPPLLQVFMLVLGGLLQLSPPSFRLALGFAVSLVVQIAALLNHTGLVDAPELQLFVTVVCEMLH